LGTLPACARLLGLMLEAICDPWYDLEVGRVATRSSPTNGVRERASLATDDAVLQADGLDQVASAKGRTETWRMAGKRLAFSDTSGVDQLRIMESTWGLR
jgi:hypothetical protein